MKSKLLRNILLTATAVGMITSNTAFAQTVDQKASYDTFTFMVNGVVPTITDFAKKPFVSNNRTYIPISTLSDLGICSVQWIPPANGMPSQVVVTESPNALSAQGQLAAMRKFLDEKDKKIKELEEKIKKLENAQIEKKKEEDSKASDRDLRRKASDLEYDINRDRDFNRIKIPTRNGSYFDIEYEFDYRRDLDVNVYIKSLRSDDVKKLKDEERELKYMLEDVADKITKEKDFKNTNVYFRVIDKQDRNNELFRYDYKDGRLR